MREIITDELDRYRIERTAREVAPLVTALRAAGRGRPRAPSSSATGPSSSRSTPTRATRSRRSPAASSTSCCTSRPSALKDAAGTARGELYADALAELFDLPELPTTTLTTE